MKTGNSMKKSRNQREKRGRRIANLFLLPSFAGVLLFFVLPFLIVIYYAVVDNPISHQFVFLDNFINVFHNAAFQQAAKNTMTFSLSAGPLAVVLSLLLAMLMESRIPCKSQFRTFFLSPMMVPIASVVLIWQVLFHYNGMMNEILGHFGIDKIDWLNSGYAQVVIVILFLWKNLGYNMILFKQYSQGHIGGGGIGKRNAVSDLLAYQTALYVIDHPFCDNYVSHKFF